MIRASGGYSSSALPHLLTLMRPAPAFTVLECSWSSDLPDSYLDSEARHAVVESIANLQYRLNSFQYRRNAVSIGAPQLSSAFI